MKTAEEILWSRLNKTVVGLPGRKAILDSMEEYASQFKPKWISVEDELPKDHQVVLMCSRLVRASGIFMIGEFHSDFKIPEHQDVTHWMPLPERPNLD